MFIGFEEINDFLKTSNENNEKAIHKNELILSKMEKILDKMINSKEYNK